MKQEQKNPLENALKNIIGSLGGKGKFTEEDLAAAWKVCAGEKAAGHSRPRSLRGSRLVVSVNDSGWLYELTVRKKELLRELSSELNSKKIKEITFRIGEIK
jgi:predicted nucleic acid-binding Zn ribbon protein